MLVGEVVAVEDLAGRCGARLGCNWRPSLCGERRFATVCGAPNVRAGMKAAFAPAGITLAGGVTIAAAEVGGRSSEGVLCSPRELGMSRWHEGLLECPASVANGQPRSSAWCRPTTSSSRSTTRA